MYLHQQRVTKERLVTICMTRLPPYFVPIKSKSKYNISKYNIEKEITPSDLKNPTNLKIMYLL